MNNLIRREDAIAKFKKTCTSESIDKNGIKRGEIRTAMTYEGIIKIIESLPTAEKWIPVSEALPKDMDRILATIVRPNGEKRVRSGDYFKGDFMMDNGDIWNETDKEVIAWMPLIEPYRGDR